MEAVSEVKVMPAVGACDRGVHFTLQCAQPFDARIALCVGMEAVIELGQADVIGPHDFAACPQVRLTERFQGFEVIGKRKGLERI